MRPTLNFASDCFTTESLEIRPWPDEVIDSLGFDPRSTYVEAYWLGILGPSTTWLIRRLVAGLEERPDGFKLPLAETARSLGLGDRGGRHSPFIRAITRTIQFDLATPKGDTVLAVHRKLPPLNLRQIERLPLGLQAAHARWQEQQLQVPSNEGQRRRVRMLALSIVENGDDLESAERHLLSWGYHPALANDAAGWAWARHRAALTAIR